jgi:RNA polymerase sigma factor (sigma-70 family)
VPFPELISEGNMALIKAIDKFDSERGVRFITCAVWWIKHDIAEFIINSNKREDVLNESEVMGNLYADHIGDRKPIGEEMTEDTLFEKFANKELVTSLSSSLDERGKNIIEMNFGLNGNSQMTLAEIGKELGLSRERVRQIKEESLRQLRYKSVEIGAYS